MKLPVPPNLTSRHALFLDFDGTLAPLQDDAARVRMTDLQIELLLRLAERQSGAVAIISGRDVRDLSLRVPDALLRIGNHGLYRMGAGTTEAPGVEALPSTLKGALESLVAKREGAFLEAKGPVGTIHFRRCPEHGPSLIDGVRTAMTTYPGYRTKVGNNVVEAVPNGANKGVALEQTMATAQFRDRIPIMVGDDTTDEDGFLAAQRLGGFGVKVGAGATGARKRLRNVGAVWNWLEMGL